MLLHGNKTCQRENSCEKKGWNDCNNRAEHDGWADEEYKHHYRKSPRR